MSPSVKGLLQARRFKDAVVAHVHQKQDVSCQELQQVLEPYMPVYGTQVLLLGDKYPNIAHWLGLSQELTELILDLLRVKRLHMHPADPTPETTFPGIPLAKMIKGYQEPHILPVVFCTYPHPRPGEPKNWDGAN